MFTIINDGDILKLVPRIENGIPIWITRVACVNYLNGTVFLEDKWIHELALKKILPFTYSVRYYVNILTKNNEIKVISFGRGLKNIISDNKQLLKLRSNWHLNVKIEKINKFNSFDKSYPIEMDWIYPISDLNSKEEWLLFLEKNQPDLESFIKERNIYNKRDELAQVFGNDLISELISKERDEKINKLIDI